MKKAIRLGKDNNPNYGGEKVFFATKHSKETVLKPILAMLGLECVWLDADTDRFETFSGEVERVEGVRATLRLKTNAAAKLKPEARFFLASEGSFGPHPLTGIAMHPDFQLAKVFLVFRVKNAAYSLVSLKM